MSFIGESDNAIFHVFPVSLFGTIMIVIVPTTKDLGNRIAQWLECRRSHNPVSPDRAFVRSSQSGNQQVSPVCVRCLSNGIGRVNHHKAKVFTVKLKNFHCHHSLATDG